jgi:hypothetical protein
LKKTNIEKNWGLKKGVIDFVAVVQRVCVCVCCVREFNLMKIIIIKIIIIIIEYKDRNEVGRDG